MAKGEGPVVTPVKSEDINPHNLLDFISLVDYYHAQEKSGGDIDAGFLLFKQKFRIFECGFLETMWGSLLGFVFAPLALGVIEKSIPVFGSTSPNLFDEIFVFLLAISFSVAFSFILSDVARQYVGSFTKAVIRQFFWGAFVSKALFTFLGFILYHTIYIKVANEQNIIGVLKLTKVFLEPRTIVYIYEWMMEFRKVFISSAWFLLGTAVLFVTIPLVSMFKTVRKYEKFGGL